MSSVSCSGLQAPWVNGWLAAVGATVLVKEMRLHWTEEATPVAVLSGADMDPVEEIVGCWPDRGQLEAMPVAETWNGHAGLERKVPWTVFSERARKARADPDSWTLSSTMTDLCVDPKNGEVAHARFDPAGPGTIKWLHHRLMKAHAHVERPREDIPSSLMGRGRRVQDNGLGFDAFRLGSLADDTKRWIDPVVEVLAFFGLALFPVRVAGSVSGGPAIQRGWERRSERGSAGRSSSIEFFWPAWSKALDRVGIDALLDVWAGSRWKGSQPLLGVHAAWRTRRYLSRGSFDPTRGFASERLSP